MNAADICVREVVVARADDTLLTAARLMREHHVGDIVIVEASAGRNVPVGILTDRDIVVGPVANAPDTIGWLKIDEIARGNLITIGEDIDVLDVLATMRNYGVRRLPVVDGQGALIGLVAFDDIVEVLGKALSGVGTLIGQAERQEERRTPAMPAQAARAGRGGEQGIQARSQGVAR